MGDGESPNLKGMTANERLYATGLMGRFGDAIRRRDRVEAVTILREVEWEPAEDVVDQMLANPAKFGY